MPSSIAAAAQHGFASICSKRAGTQTAAESVITVGFKGMHEDVWNFHIGD
jgi:hypothetical protein